MTSARIARVPTDHITSELAAFPLASTAALELGVTELDPRVDKDDKTGALWRAAEKHTIGGFPAFSIDEVVAIRDLVWFSRGPDRCVPLHRYLRRLANDYLELQGGIAAPRLPSDRHVLERKGRLRKPLARQAWWWLVAAMPPDLLLAALRGPDRVEVLSPVLIQLLHGKHYAQTHLHIGAALDFPSLWVGALVRIADSRTKPQSFRSPGAVWKEGALLGPWLLRAAIARYVLAAFLVSPHRSKGFEHFLSQCVAHEISDTLLIGEYTRLCDLLSEMRRGALARSASQSDFAALQGLYKTLTGVRTAEINDYDRIDSADPIAALLPPRDRRERTAEMRFVAAALAHLDELDNAGAPSNNGLFAALFWQVVRVRSIFYRHVVQRPMTPGLQWFIRFFGRLSPAKSVFGTQARVDSAARLGGAGRGLCSLELRTSPSPDRSELLQFVRDVDVAATRIRKRLSEQSDASSKPLEVGVVFHFCKDRGGGALEGRPAANWATSHANPFHRNRPRLRGSADTRFARSSGLPGMRYARFYSTVLLPQADALAWLLRHFPLSLETIRGVDVCTDELGVPNWVMAPMLNLARGAARTAATAVRRETGREIPSLRTTVHAGEDFVHLLTGLRNLDEAISHYDLREGDRIGHGLSLGVEPREWARRAGRIAIAREERLFDLVWVWTCCRQTLGDAISSESMELEYEIAELTYKIFDEPGKRPPTIHQLATLQRDLCNFTRLQEVGFPGDYVFRPLQYDARNELLCRYLTDANLFRRGRKNTWIDPSSEGDLLVSLQNALRTKVGSLGITVEVNPTSNLLIGDFGDLTNHPLWRLRSPLPGADAPPVSVCIGSDDPIVFASDLRQEYQRLADAMALAGLSEEQARQWLDRARSSGLESRFTLPPSSNFQRAQLATGFFSQPADYVARMANS